MGTHSTAGAATPKIEPDLGIPDKRPECTPLDLQPLRVPDRTPEGGQAVPVFHPYISEPNGLPAHPLVSPPAVLGLGGTPQQQAQVPSAALYHAQQAAGGTAAEPMEGVVAASTGMETPAGLAPLRDIIGPKGSPDLGPRQGQMLWPCLWRQLPSAAAAGDSEGAGSPRDIAVPTPQRRSSRGGSAYAAYAACLHKPAAQGPARIAGTPRASPASSVSAASGRRPRSAAEATATSADRAAGAAGEDEQEGEEAAPAAALAGGSHVMANGQRLSIEGLEADGYFDMKLEAAALKLGVGTTKLKNLCRNSGMPRWPFRARTSLRNLLRAFDSMRGYFAGGPADELAAAEQLLKDEFSRLSRRGMKDGAIDGHVKKFRQAIFKMDFKARKQLKEEWRRTPSKQELRALIQTDPSFRQEAMLHLRRLLDACGI